MGITLADGYGEDCDDSAYGQITRIAHEHLCRKELYQRNRWWN